MSQQVQIKEQRFFPLLKEYKQHFDVTPQTIFAWNGTIYTNFTLTEDLLIHEKRHLAQQEKYGLETWVKNFLKNPKKRLEYEIDAYITQLKSIKDRELRNKIRIESANNLGSSLYGNIITPAQAFKLLKINY